jgi:uncharacterized protein (TIGR02300 family)
MDRPSVRRPEENRSVKPEWGTKRQCPECSTRFYDLQKDPVTCPHCGAEFEPESLLKARRPRVERRAAPARKVEKPRPAFEDEDTGEDKVLEDADDDADDDDDLADDEGDIDEDVDSEDLVDKPSRGRASRDEDEEDTDDVPIEEDNEDEDEDLDPDEALDEDEDIDLDDEVIEPEDEEDDTAPGGRRKRGK